MCVIFLFTNLIQIVHAVIKIFHYFQMNYNFNSQFPFQWSPAAPYMPNAFQDSNTGALPHTIHPTAGSQAGFTVAQVPGPSTGGFQPLIPGVRFHTGMFPYGMNGPYPNWNYTYSNDPVTHFNQLQSPPDQTA